MADDDIDALMSSLPDPSGAPRNDEADIAHMLSSLDTPAAKNDVTAKKTTVAASSLPYADKVIMHESGGNANAKNPKSSATGTGQFLNATWLPLVKRHRPDVAQGKSDSEIQSLRTDPQLSREMIDAYGNENAERLKAAGIPVNDASKYGAHWFGADNFAKIYNADPLTPIENIIGNDAAQNNGIAGKTADEVKQLAANRMFMPNMPQELSWGDTGALAASHLLPSAGHAIAGVYEAVRHPVDTATTLKKIAVGLDSKIEGYAGRDQDPEQKKNDEALVDALGASYKEKYGSMDGFKQALAHDPASVLFDASTVLTAGGGAAARVPGIIGQAGRAAGTVGKIINPINPAGIITGTAKTVVGTTKVLDDAGNILPKVDQMIQKVTDDAMSGADLVDPAVKQAFAATIAKKGLNTATVKEALLRSRGLEAPTHVTTGIASPMSARERVMRAVDDNNDKITAQAGRIAGAPSTSDIGAALDAAHAKSINSASDAYEQIRTMPGSFGSRMPNMATLGKSIADNFRASGISAADLKTLKATGHPQAAAALQLLNSTWARGKTVMRKGTGFTAPEILAMRKALNNFRAAATGSDVKAVGDITDAFDKYIADSSKKGLFVDTNGKPVQGLWQQITAANAAYRNHFNAFETPNGANNSVVNAVRKLKTGQGRGATGNVLPSGDADLYAQAQGQLTKDLFHPTKGRATYNQLASAMGTSGPLDDFIKSSVMNTEKPIKGVADMLNDPNSVVAKAFSGAPDSLSEAKHIHAVRALNNAKPTLDSRGHSILKGALGTAASKGLSSVLGYETMGIPGLIVGNMLEGAGEHLVAGNAAKKAMSGAPYASGKTARTLKGATRFVTHPAAIAAEHYADQANEPENTVIQRARGGKVDMDSLVTRLMNRWKSAKKATDKTTKPLLHLPDDAVIKALDIAQEHI